MKCLTDLEISWQKADGSDTLLPVQWQMALSVCQNQLSHTNYTALWI